ncbi:MAG: HEAT repeat domain-containing protein [Candidatus Sifarchaeia archaeon]
MAWHDGLDVNAINSLTGEEKEEAEHLLIEALQKSNDYRPIVGLGYLRSKKALPILKEKLNHLWGKALVDAASALRKIENDDSYAENIIRVLKNDASFYNRLVAAIELRNFKTPEVVKALFEAVKDPEYLVRNHACESLLFLHGFKPEIVEHEEIFQNIIGSPEGDGLTTEDEIKQFDQAILQLKELFKRKDLDSTKSNAQKYVK